MGGTMTPHDQTDHENLVFTGDIADYWSCTQVHDYLLVMPELPHTALRLYELLRSMIAESQKHQPDTGLRQVSIDQLCWLLPGVNGKPTSASLMYELLGTLEHLDLVTPTGMQEIEGVNQLKGKEKAVRGILRGFQVKDLPPTAYTGWRNALDKLDAYEPEWRENAPQPPTHLTMLGASDDEGHQMTEIQRMTGPAEPKRNGRTAVYRLHDDAGRLLYLGIAGNYEQRWEQHSRDKYWWHLVARKEVAWCETRQEAQEAEKLGIRDEKPIYNQAWSTTRTSDSPPDDPFREPLVEALRESIKEGRYSPGHVFTDDLETAPSFGVSHVTLSAALIRLADDGVISCGPLVWQGRRRARSYTVK
ncbi:hypothetical protein AB0B07_33155 [Streptomyces sioyaensis]|uniref:hypothetical protein n=1 Tax=Streptomyces sioyaensis TaxID=67364 RepID=UPI0033EB5714